MDFDLQEHSVKEEFLDFTEETDTECASLESAEAPNDKVSVQQQSTLLFELLKQKNCLLSCLNNKFESSKVKLCDEKLFELIRAYESHPCLWLKTHEDYKDNYYNRKKKRKAISEMAKNFNLPEKLIKGKLRILRTVFFQNLQKIQKAKKNYGDHAQQPKWRFFNALSFLISESETDSTVVKPLTSSNLTSITESPKVNSASICTSATSNDSCAVEPLSTTNAECQTVPSTPSCTSALTTRFSSNFESPANDIASESHATSSSVMSGKKRSHEERNLERYPTLMRHLRPQANHEEFLTYVGSTLTQIKDESLIKRAKCQIQLVLTKILAEHAEHELEILNSNKTLNGSVDEF